MEEHTCDLKLPHNKHRINGNAAARGGRKARIYYTFIMYLLWGGRQARMKVHLDAADDPLLQGG